jgi:type II secretory pathway pseudopilin PulG
MLLTLPTIRSLRQQGDTIVEVLISIAVVSLILGGAYVSTNRSLQATRDAQERGVAIKLAESQIEQLKNIDKPTLFGTTLKSYCIVNGGLVDSDDPACLVGADGLPTPPNSGPAYHIVVTPSVTNPNTFTVKNSWTSVRGDTQASVELAYRVHP